VSAGIHGEWPDAQKTAAWEACSAMSDDQLKAIEPGLSQAWRTAENAVQWAEAARDDAARNMAVVQMVMLNRGLIRPGEKRQDLY
jgi:hypothetical protein